MMLCTKSIIWAWKGLIVVLPYSLIIQIGLLYNVLYGICLIIIGADWIVTKFIIYSDATISLVLHRLPQIKKHIYNKILVQTLPKQICVFMSNLSQATVKPVKKCLFRDSRHFLFICIDTPHLHDVHYQRKCQRTNDSIQRTIILQYLQIYISAGKIWV